ncbi:hypothetical protein P872_24485 [Rhodonellum psychrophilum GCM71 = DSM 17998]|uniref:DNA-binding protein n=2 Tax=Rhodonellum TaxID=336827 RepID=U5C438_9BACT|nr:MULTISPECIES: DUF177 domain-containing protein [Rhodonellum]ERM84579.1 hypothetical protein P872_24485 [Rhodonellum psychrophilum GCM71 = DSM 17998]SDY85673.1 Uncharacterized ACR, COG1399 [Rhodonellum ikkaensis]
MKFLKAYDIDLIKLKEGKHDFTFEVKDDFFGHFDPNDFVSQGNLSAKIQINKQSSLIEAYFEIKGTVKLTCDRSLEEFDFPLSTVEKVIYKYGPEEQELSEDLFMIPQDTQSINVAQLIYEFILLALPAKKIHPDYLEEMDDEDFEGDGDLVYISDRKSDDADEITEASEEPKEDLDPRWEVLKKLKKKD